MATEMKATGTGVVFYRLNVRQFEQMIDAGIFPEGAHVELLAGVLVDKMTKNDPHDATVGWLCDALRRVLPPGCLVREEKSLRLGHLWRPEPDITVVRGQWQDFRARTPRADDVALLIEVADVSYPKDRGAKWRRYAAAGIPVYWIVHLAKRQIEVYNDPTGHGLTAVYRTSRVYGRESDVPLVIEGREIGQFAVRDILP